MSNTHLVKAELIARRNARELERSLDRLGGKIEEDTLKAQSLFSRAVGFWSKFGHPRETASNFLRTELSQLAPRTRIGLAASAASILVAVTLIAARRRRMQISRTAPPVEEAQFYSEVA